MHPIRRLIIEGIGWIMAIIGGYYVFGMNDKLIIHYLLLIVGIILIIMNFPFKDFFGKVKRK